MDTIYDFELGDRKLVIAMGRAGDLMRAANNKWLIDPSDDLGPNDALEHVGYSQAIVDVTRMMSDVLGLPPVAEE